MRDRLAPSLILIGVATIFAAFAFQSGGPPAAEAIDVDPVIWHLDRDYPETLPGDLELPIRTVYIKTHDGSDWMSTYDTHPYAVSGPAAIKELISIYGTQGIKVAAWFNPTRTDYAAQLEIAKQVVDSGVTALYADVEPYPGFCYLHCRGLAENVWKPLREARPNATLGVIYDPRPWWWEQQALSHWLPVADAALPMCYWEDYAGQGVWNDPAGCVLQAHSDLSQLAPGRSFEYIPMLQGNATAARFEKALDAAASLGAEKVSVYRRGTVQTEVWELIGKYQEPDFVLCRETLADGCLFREVSSTTVYLTAGGAKFRVPSLEAFHRMGFKWNDVQIVENGFLAPVSIIPREGTLLREENSSFSYVVLAGSRFVAAAADFAALGLDPLAVRSIPIGGLEQIPAVPADFSRLREVSQTDEYLVVRGMRILVDAEVGSALNVLGLNQPPIVVPDLALENFPPAEVGRGDADCNGHIDPADVLHALRLSTRMPTGAVCYQSADVNCDGNADSVDALLILAFVVGKSSLVPGCDPVGTPTSLN